MKLLKMMLAAAVLAACAAAPQNPQQAVYDVKAKYNAALNIAVAYKQLPPCTPAATILCSKPDVVLKLQQADNVAYPAIQAAENTVRSPGAGANAQTAITAAQQAVQALTAITATLEVKR
jgi:hypothetical protein